MNRFVAGNNSQHAMVIDCSIEEYNKAAAADKQRTHELAVIKIGGMISKNLAVQWTEEIAAKLNQFDVANAAVAKMSPIT